MELKYRHLIGRPFNHGSTDCYGLVRDFFRDNFDIVLPNFARPENWDQGGEHLDLYMDSFYDQGFRAIDEHPSRWRLGDVVLVAIRSKVANHAAIFVEPGRVLHHLYRQLSVVTEYRGLLRNNTVAVLRHKDVVIQATPTEKLSIMEVVPDAVRQELLAAIQQRQG